MVNQKTRKVYAKDRKTVLAEVSVRATSIGAAKAAGVKSCKMGAPAGESICDSWIAA